MNKIFGALTLKSDESEENHILPFLWLHGESEPVIREEIRRVHESGISEICVESRPHPDFAGPGWWQDLDIIIDEAKNLGMRIWILDDAHFPTGFANGWIRDRFPERRKVYLAEKHIDAIGPFEGAAFFISEHLLASDEANDADVLLGVVAVQRSSITEEMDDTSIDITDKMNDGTIFWDVPVGMWRIFILFLTQRHGGDQDYINMVDPASVRVQIDAVYEPHFEHYSNEFGKTIAGFFSDEPGFGNTKISFFDDAIGKKQMVLPWSCNVQSMLYDALRDEFRTILPFLWYDSPTKACRVRYTYMDIITKLYSQCFTTQIAEWCHAHGVEYIGHVMEDQNVHSRLGPGSGHFFRSMSAQDMSGIDTVYQQLTPGFDRHVFRWMRMNWDGEFFHYALAKMGSSLGHLDPKKKGRTVCEIFGAYGWQEGLKQMKWQTDHMLVRGVNWFVPHAFSPKDFPDEDCPPHFYARNQNAQFRYLKYLMDYTNKMCRILSGGIHIAPAAILYHAEAEWLGEYMPCQKPARILTQSQIDFDIIPVDVLTDSATFNSRIENGKLFVNNEEFKVLVIPYSQRISCLLAKFIRKAASAGLKIVFVDRYPEAICEMYGYSGEDSISDIIAACDCEPLESLSTFLRSRRIYDIQIETIEPYLRYYRYRKDGREWFMFFNEAPYKQIETWIHLPISGSVHEFNAFDSSSRKLFSQKTNQGNRLRISLCPYESVLLFMDCAFDDSGAVDEFSYFPEEETRSSSGHIIEGVWKVSSATSEEYPVFTERCNLSKLIDLSKPERMPRFSGTLRYSICFPIAEADTYSWIDLGAVFETSDIVLNGIPLGIRICPPYRYNITGILVSGVNDLQIEVTNTVVRQVRDEISIYRMIEPTGLLGPVKVG